MTHTALLVIDLQRGAFDGVRCPPIDRADTLIDNAVRLVDAAREANAPIVFIQHCDVAGEVFEENTPYWALHQALLPRPEDTLLSKYASSAFEGTGLAQTLRGLGAQRLLLCGLQSEFCISNTAKSALAEGFSVVLAQDGHSTWPSNGETAAEISEQVNTKLQALGAVLGSTQDLARSLREARG
jgi:nicotinamidase-related amidase